MTMRHERPTDTPRQPVLPASFYRLLTQLLSLPEIDSVSFRGDADFEFLRLACAERMRRRSDVESLPAHEGFTVNVLDANSRWNRAIEDDEEMEESERTIPAWIYSIQFWDEGLGPSRDFLIEAPPEVGIPLSRMPDDFPVVWKAIVSFLDPALALEGYKWFRHTDRFCVGVRLREERIARTVEEWRQTEAET